jgi:hypothetical protein
MSLISSHSHGERKGRAAAAPKDDSESGPLNIKEGTRVFAKFRDGTERKAVVIDKKPIVSDETLAGKHRYYVHWVDLNRRMDSWVISDDVRYDEEGDAQAKKDAKATGPSGAGGEGHGKSSGVGKSGAAAGGGSHHAHAHADGDIVDSDGTILRTKRKADGELFIENVEPEHETAGLTEASIMEHEEITKARTRGHDRWLLTSCNCSFEHVTVIANPTVIVR